MTSILIVGDGNLSFSSALARMLKPRSDVSMVASTFESSDELEVRSSGRSRDPADI